MRLGLLNREIESFHAAALILGSAALVSKLLGLLRDRLLASRFGAGDVLDVYYAAFQIPDFLYTVFLIGAASAAVLPVFLAEERRSREDAEAFISNLLTVFSIGAVLAVLVAIALAPWLIQLAAPGFSPAKLAAAIGLTRIMMANAIFLGIAGILSSVLQARHRFFAFALPPVVYNLGIIGGILFVVPWLGPIGLAYGVLWGGALQVLVVLPAVLAMRFQLRPVVRLGHAALRRVVRTALPRVAALSMSQLTLVALSAIASFFAAGSISVFRFAVNLLYVPVGLFGVSYALAMFPKLSGASLDGQGEAFREQVGLGIRNILFWALPLAVLCIVLRAHIVRVVLGSGAFDWEDTRLVAAVLALLAAAIVSESVLPLILRAFYALDRTREPLVWDIVASVLTVVLAVGIAAWFTASPPVLQALAEWLRIGDLAYPRILAVALAFAVGSLANAALLALALRRAAQVKLRVRLSFEWAAAGAMLGASVLAGLAAYGALQPFPALVATDTFVGIALQGLVAGAAGLSVYGLILAWQKNPEMASLIESLRRRLVSLKRTPQVYGTEKLDGEGTR